MSRRNQNIHPTEVKPKVVRCAVYTRKSTEEGLEQAFNTLDAQREAGEAYVAAQKHEGWVCLPDPIEVTGLRRVRPESLWWWLNRVRGLEFQVPKALERIETLTGGVPILVAVLDGILGNVGSDGGLDVDAVRFEAAVARFATTVADVARDLSAGPPAVRLLPREIEIPRMVRVAGRYCADADELPELLTNQWEVVAEVEGISDPPPPVGPSDRRTVGPRRNPTAVGGGAVANEGRDGPPRPSCVLPFGRPG